MATPAKRPLPRRSGTKLGKLIAAARERHRDNRLSCSRLLRVSPTTVANWEDRGVRPIASQRMSLAQYIGVSLVEIDRLCERGAR